MYQQCFHRLAVAGLCLAAAMTSSAQIALYQQPPTTNGYQASGSTNTPTEDISVTYDNFTLSAAANVAYVNWQGIYVDLDNPSGNPESLDTASFIITFYADAGGQPGAAISSQTLPITNCNAVNLGDVNFTNNNTITSVQVPLYSYSVELPTPFAAAAGVQYWMSIVSNCTAQDPRWQWTSGTGGDNLCFQAVASGLYEDAEDRTFTLAAAHVPFFTGEVDLGSGVYFLNFPNLTPFGYYSYLTDPDYIFHFDLGYEYVFNANDGASGVYLYDFASGDFFYTSPAFPFPYLYDFTLNTVLYYYPDTSSPGHYTSNPRYFYDYASKQIITR